MAKSGQCSNTMVKFARSVSIASGETAASLQFSGDVAYASEGCITSASGISTVSSISERAYIGMVCGDSSMDMYLEDDESYADVSEPIQQADELHIQDSAWGLSAKALFARFLGAMTLASISSQQNKRIVEVKEYDIPNMYRIGSKVMDSVHKGMQIFFATRVKDGMKVVIKTRLKRKSFKTPADENAWRRSTESQLNMPKVETICQFLEVLETPRYYYVVMEKVGGQDLCEQLADEHLPHLDAREVIRQVLLALEAMHMQGRIHKDLKLENVMVDLNSRRARARVALAEADGEPVVSAAEVKLIDFDTVTDWEPSKPKDREILGTDGYIAPEAYGGDYSPASDMYAVGVILYKILTGLWPLELDIFDDGPGENYVGSSAMMRIQMKLKNEKIDFTLSPFDGCAEAADLAAKLLAYDPEERPSAEQALAHEWFFVHADTLPPTPVVTSFCR